MLLGAIYGLAVGIRNLGFIFNIVGAVASNSIGLILPGLFVWLLSRRLGKEDAYSFMARAIFFATVPMGLFCVACEIIGIAND